MTKRTIRVLGAIVVGALTIVAALILFGGAAFAAGSISLDSPTAGGDGTATMTLTATAPSGSGIGNWTFDIGYDPAAYSSDPTCSALFGACAIKPGGTDGTVRFVGADGSATGLTGTVEIGTITFVTTKPPGECSPVGFILPVGFQDQNGVDIPNPTFTYGQVCAAVATPTPTPPLATPTHTPTGPTPTLAPCDGTWNVVTTPSVQTPASVFGVSGMSPDDVWAVGSRANLSLIMHWDGSGWTTPSTGPQRSPSYLAAVAAVSHDDAWAVGSAGSLTWIMRLQQGTWNWVPSVDPGATFNTLSSVAVVSASDVWAVGSSSSSPGDSQSLIEHWDGNAWTVVASPGGSSLASVAAISSNDVWAVGFEGSLPNSTTLIEHWDGSTWSVVNSPLPSASFTDELRLSSVSAASASDIWAVGGFTSSGGPQSLLEHFDGSSWTIVPSPNSAANYDELISIAAISSNNVWAVGSSESKQFPPPPVPKTLVKHWDGQAWSIVPSSSPSTSSNSLTSIAAITPGDLWAVGAVDQLAGSASPLVLHFCGQLATPPHTDLAQDAPAGATSLDADKTGFAARDEIVIDPGGANEEYSVVNSLGSLDLAAPLQFAHSSGEQVVRVATGISAGDANCDNIITIDDALSVLRRVAGLAPYDHCVAAGNVVCTDGYTALDALDVLLYVSPVNVFLPQGCPPLPDRK